MKKFLFIVVLTVFTFFFSLNSIDRLVLMTEEYPPFNFSTEENAGGISVDLLEQIFHEMGKELDRNDIQVLPWARGYDRVQNEKNSMLFVMSRTTEREDMFKWVGPITTSVNGIIAKKSSNITINSAEDLKNYRISTIIDDVGEQLLVSEGLDIDTFIRVSEMPQIVNMLEHGRVDLWSYNTSPAFDQIESMGFDPDDFEVVYILSELGLYYALNPQTPDDLIKKMQTVLDNLREKGVIDNIVEKY